MRKWITRAIVVAALGVALALIWWGLLVSDPVPVTVVRVERGEVESTVVNSKAGTVMARRRSRLSPETGGRVAALPHREGASIRAGDVLLRLDGSSQRARLTLEERSLEATRAKREQACTAAGQAEREFHRFRALADKGIVSENLIEGLESEAATTAAACRAARADVERAAAAVEVAEAELRKTVVEAPFDGMVADVTTEIGEWITPSPPGVPIPPVLDVYDPSSIYISAPMDEVDSARIRVGQPVRVTLDPYPDDSFPGTVVRIAPYVLDIEAQNRTVEIEVELDDEEFATTLLPGTSADTEVILEVVDDVPRIPTSALLAGDRVLTVEDGRLAERSVEIGLRNWDYTQILDGLGPGDAVVTSLDRPEVVPGAEVVIREPDEAASGTG